MPIIEEDVEDVENAPEESDKNHLAVDMIAQYQKQNSKKDTFRLKNNNHNAGSNPITEEYIQGLIE